MRREAEQLNGCRPIGWKRVREKPSRFQLEFNFPGPSSSPDEDGSRQRPSMMKYSLSGADGGCGLIMLTRYTLGDIASSRAEVFHHVQCSQAKPRRTEGT